MLNHMETEKISLIQMISVVVSSGVWQTSQKSWGSCSTARSSASCQSHIPSSSGSTKQTAAQPCGSARTCGGSSTYGKSTEYEYQHKNNKAVCSLLSDCPGRSHVLNELLPVWVLTRVLFFSHLTVAATATWILPSGTTQTSGCLRSRGFRGAYCRRQDPVCSLHTLSTDSKKKMRGASRIFLVLF